MLYVFFFTQMFEKGNIINSLLYIGCCLCVCVSHSVVSNSLQPHGLYSPPGSSVHGIL